MTRKTSNSTVTSPADAARVFAASIEAALTEIEADPSGLTPLHRALATRIRCALGQMLACAEQLASDELMLLGSTGQLRPHPLLKTAQELRKEISDGLKDLSFRLEQQALFAQATALTRRPRNPTAEEPGEPS